MRNLKKSTKILLFGVFIATLMIVSGFLYQADDQGDFCLTTINCVRTTCLPENSYGLAMPYGECGCEWFRCEYSPNRSNWNPSDNPGMMR